MRSSARVRQALTLLCSLWVLDSATLSAAEPDPIPASEPAPVIWRASGSYQEQPLTALAQDAKTLLKNLAFPKSKQVPYVETQMNPMLKEPVTQSGHVEITEDGAFIMQVATPRPELRRLERGKLSLKRPSRSALKRNPSEALNQARARTLTLNPEHSGHLVLLAITQVLSGDIEALNQHFSLESTPGAPWHVVLTPKNVKVKKRLQRLELFGIEDQLLSLYTQRTNDAWQKLTFSASEP